MGCDTPAAPQKATLTTLSWGRVMGKLCPWSMLSTASIPSPQGQQHRAGVFRLPCSAASHPAHGKGGKFPKASLESVYVCKHAQKHACVCKYTLAHPTVFPSRAGALHGKPPPGDKSLNPCWCSREVNLVDLARQLPQASF